MKIHQIQIRHQEAEDRLLLRLSTSDNSEFRFWLTRRFVKRLWELLVQMLDWDNAVRQQVNPDTRRTVLDLQHEGYAQQADYSKPFEESPRLMPLGEVPTLVASATGKKGDGGVLTLSLHPQQGQGIDMTLDTGLLHIFTRLLRDAVAGTDWDVNLALYQAQDKDAQSPNPLPRKLN